MVKAQTEDYKRELVTIFFSQKNIIILTTILIFGCAVFIGLFWPKTYAAYGSILVKSRKVEKSPDALESQQITSFQLKKEDLSSEVQFMTSTEVLKMVVLKLREKKLIKEKNEEPSIYRKYKEMILKYLRKMSVLSEKEKETEDALLMSEVAGIKSCIKTEIVPGSNVISITYSIGDPDLAKETLMTLMDEYIIYRNMIFYPKKAREFFSDQADIFKRELEGKGEDLISLFKENRISDPVKEIDSNLAIVQDLELQLNLLTNDDIEKELEIMRLEKTINAKGIQFFLFIKDIPINSTEGLSPKLQQLVVERGTNLRTYHPNSQKIRAMDQQINDLYEKLKKEVKEYVADLQNQRNITLEQIDQITGRIVEMKERNVLLQEVFLKSQILGNDIKLQLDSYDTFSRRKEEARINSSNEVSQFFISILKKAIPSNGPIFPKPGIIIPLGLIVGFITGCSVGFMREYFDHTFKKPSDVSHYVDLPLIFSIPVTK